MDNSVTLIGIALAIITILPLYFSYRSNSLNKARIQAIKEKYSQNGKFNFDLTESQNKKILAIDKKNKGFISMNFNKGKDESSFIDLNGVKSCRLVPTTDASSDTIIKVDFEFQDKTTGQKIVIPFYNIEDDQINQVCLHEDQQLGKKWVQIIQDCISD
ncbi:hypothetical protein QWY99_12575 [Flavobacterium branchiarum]|uniref:Uncharacterized protein n=1 Tax=Flavobacterium branchiarum TaxID=1114870 RepID=A0ABV5FHH5_9FLAO|nr:hypothetical protein [Flavobacterium branchiarum]MDN3673886.1 hypothetical protein [Flavobacterium branchiarum]